jgi:hypothetical protein
MCGVNMQLADFEHATRYVTLLITTKVIESNVENRCISICAGSKLPCIRPSSPKGFVSMLMEKLRKGVLQVSTDRGLRIVHPSWSERLKLLWIFRNFHVLNQEVLSTQEVRLINHICVDDRMCRPQVGVPGDSAYVIGTVERTAPAPSKMRVQRATTGRAKRAAAN